jgi:hypothetical protein
VAAPPAESSSPREVVGPAPRSTAIVSRIAARGGWSPNDRRRDGRGWFDAWSAATHRPSRPRQEALRERLGRDFIADDAAAIARLVPLYAWDEAGGTLRRVGADGKPFALDDGEAEVVTTVASK